MQSRDLFEFIHRPLAESSYAIASAVGVASLFEVIDAVESGSIRYAATTEGILVPVLLAAFFALAAAYWRWPGHIYPALFAATIACQLAYARTPMDLKYQGVFIALLGPLYLAGGVIAHRRGLERFAGPFQMSARAVSVYAILLAAPDAPALIAVLLVNAALYAAAAVASLVEPGESRPALVDSFGADIVHVWLALIQLMAALFVALDYQQATHLQANVAYIAFYLGIFSVSLLLRQLDMPRLKRWGGHVFTFAAIFCAAQLGLQLLAVVGTTPAHAPAPWLYSYATGPTVLTLAFVVAGFFYLASSQMYPFEVLNYAGFAFFLVAYLIQLVHLDVDLVEWYSIPIGVYVLVMGYLYQKAHPTTSTTQASNPLGFLIIVGAPTIAFMATTSPTSQLHAIAAAVLCLIFIAVGVMARIRVFFFGGVAFLAWDALYQSWEYLYALPKWATIGAIGLVMLVAAIYLERRREHVLDLARRARRTLTEEWK